MWASWNRWAAWKHNFMTPHRLWQALNFSETSERNAFPGSWQRRRSALKSECFLTLRKPLLVRLCVVAWVLCNVFSIFYRAIFVRPSNENARTKQKQQTNGNSAIWLVYWTNTNAYGFWLVKRTLRWENYMPENFLEINRYFALRYTATRLAGKRRVHVLIFSSIGW